MPSVVTTADRIFVIFVCTVGISTAFASCNPGGVSDEI